MEEMVPEFGEERFARADDMLAWGEAEYGGGGEGRFAVQHVLTNMPKSNMPWRYAKYWLENLDTLWIMDMSLSYRAGEMYGKGQASPSIPVASRGPTRLTLEGEG